MIIELDDTVFHLPDETARRRLSALVYNAGHRGHSVHHVAGDPLLHGSLAHEALVAAPVFPPADKDWLADRLRIGFEEAQKPNASRRIIRVHAGPSDWSNMPPVLSIEELVDYLMRPVALLVEDEPTERRFLECWVPTSRRADFTAALARGALEVTHGGGITSIMRRISSAATRSDLSFLHRVVAVFDSDAPAPREPSDNARRCRKTCNKYLSLPVPRFRMLERRAIENYLPLDVLDDYQKSHEGAHVHLGAVPALRGLGGLFECIHHYHMKDGLIADLSDNERKKAYRADTKLPWSPADVALLPAIWRTAPGAALEALSRGFGTHVAEHCLNRMATRHRYTFDRRAEAEAEQVFALVLGWV